MADKEESLETRDILEREFDKLEEAEPAKEEPEIETKEEASEDAKADDSETDDANPDEKEDVASDGEVTDEDEEEKPSTNWSKYGFKRDVWDKLDSLDEGTQKAIMDRQEAYFKSRGEMEGDATYGKTIKSAIEPYNDYLKQLGIGVEVAIPVLLEAERQLRTGNQHQKMLALRQLAHDYGIDMSEAAQQPFDANAYQMQQQLAEKDRQLNELQRSRQTVEEATINQTIEEFANSHEFFYDVQSTMADLLDRGLANDLDDAYGKAIRLNDDVFQHYQAKQQAGSDRQKVVEMDKAAKAAKASAVSVKGAPSGSKTSTAPRTTEEAVRLAMQEHGY